MKIGIDVDEVLCDTLAGFIAFHNQVYGSALVHADFTSYEWSSVLGLSFEEASRRVHEFLDHELFTGVAPVSGAVEAVRELGVNHELVVVTSRWDKMIPPTYTWIDAHFKNVFSDIHFSKNAFAMGNNVNTRTKADICEQEGIDLIIEDALEYAKECAIRGIEVFLYDQPWNSGALPDGMTRVESWDAVVKKMGTVPITVIQSI